MSYSLDDLRQRLALLDARVEKARERHGAAQLAAADAQVDLDLEIARRDGAAGFVAELEAETNQPQTVPKTKRTGTSPSSVGTTDLIFGILRQHPDGVHIHELQNLAAAQGHELDGEQVRSAVTYLRRRGDAENVSRGVWRVTNADYFLRLDGSADTNGTAEAVPFDELPSPASTEAAAG